MIAGGALQPGSSRGGEVGCTLVWCEGLSVDDREVEPGLAGGVDGQLHLVLVGVGDVAVGGALQDGADVVLQEGLRGSVLVVTGRRLLLWLTLRASRGDLQLAPGATVVMGVKVPFIGQRGQTC